jgi:hypothetical protein
MHAGDDIGGLGHRCRYQSPRIPTRFAFVQIFANFPLLSRHQLVMRQRSCSVNETQYTTSYVRSDIFDAQPIHFL